METLTQNVSIPKPVFHSSTFFPSKNPNSSFENDFKAIQDSDDDSLNQNDFLSEDSGTNSGLYLGYDAYLGLLRVSGDFLVYQLTAGDRMDIQIEVHLYNDEYI